MGIHEQHVSRSAAIVRQCHLIVAIAFALGFCPEIFDLPITVRLGVKSTAAGLFVGSHRHQDIITGTYIIIFGKKEDPSVTGHAENFQGSFQRLHGTGKLAPFPFFIFIKGHTADGQISVLVFQTAQIRRKHAPFRRRVEPAPHIGGPIIFATYPVVAGIPGSQQIFNVVFFITLLSLIIQGMTISAGARMLHLDLPQEKEGNEFGVELPEEIDSQLMDQTLTAEMLKNGNRLADMDIPKGTLVMLVKRGNEFIIPNGQVELYEGDKLLFISENPKNTK